MKKIIVIVLIILAIFGVLRAIDALAAANPPALGGTGTSIVPSSGQTLIGNTGGTYTPTSLYSLFGATAPLSYNASTGVVSWTNSNGYTTTTIQSVLNVFSATGLATYNSSTGVITVSSSSLALGSASHNNTGDFLASSTAFVSSFNTRTGAVTLSSGDVTSALGYTPYNSTNPSNYATTTIQSVLQSLSAAGLATYNSSTGIFTVSSSSLSLGTASQHPASDFLASSTVVNTPSTTIPTIFVTSFNGSSGIVTYAPSTTIPTVYVTSFNTRNGVVTLSSGDVTTALGFTPYNAANPSGYISSSTGNTLYYPLNSNPNGYVTSTSPTAATTTINGVTGPTFIFSITSTSSASSVTTSSAQIFLNLLKLTSSSEISISSTGTITFATNNISQFTNDAGYVTSTSGSSSTVNLTGSSTPNDFPFWLDANGNLSSSSPLSISGNVTTTFAVPIIVSSSLNAGTSTALVLIKPQTTYGSNNDFQTEGALLLNCDKDNGLCEQIAANNASSVAPLELIFQETSSDTQPTVWIKNNSTQAAATTLKLEEDGYVALSFTDDSQSTSVGQGKFQLDDHNNTFRVESRNAANNSFNTVWICAQTQMGGQCTFGGNGDVFSTPSGAGTVNIIKTSSSIPYLTISSTSTNEGDLFTFDASGNIEQNGNLNASGTISQGGVPVCLTTTCVTSSSFNGTSFNIVYWNASGTSLSNTSSIVIASSTGDILINGASGNCTVNTRALTVCGATNNGIIAMIAPAVGAETDIDFDDGAHHWLFGENIGGNNSGQFSIYSGSTGHNDIQVDTSDNVTLTTTTVQQNLKVGGTLNVTSTATFQATTTLPSVAANSILGTDASHNIVATTIPTHSITVTTSTITVSQQIYASSAVTVIVNTSTATNVVSTTIPANTLGNLGQSVRVTLYGTYLNNTGSSQVLTTKFIYGGQTFLSAGTTAIPTSASTLGFTETFLLSNASGTSNNQLGSYQIIANGINNTKQFTAGTVDSTAAQPLDISLTLASASTTLQATVNSVNITEDGAVSTVVTGVTYN